MKDKLLHFSSNNRKLNLFRSVLVFCLLVLSAPSIMAANNAETVGNPDLAAENQPGTEQYKYILENRADPFVPFITETAATAQVDMNEIVDSTEPLTGMQIFEPGQLTLVALMKIGDNDVAMVEDFTGKGYILKEGTKIGRRGVVKDITYNNVLIEETAVTRAGKEIITEVVMILKKEGEE